MGLSLKISSRELELISGLDLHENELATAKQIRANQKLYQLYTTGRIKHKQTQAIKEEAAKDKWKAAEYAEKIAKADRDKAKTAHLAKQKVTEAQQPVIQEDIQEEIQIEVEESALIAQPEALVNHQKTLEVIKQSNWVFFKTAHVYNFFGWFNSIRLLLLRLNRFLIPFGATLTSKLAVLRPILQWAGLVYFIELLVDIAIIAYSTFFAPVDADEKKMSFLARSARRFKLTLFKDDRIFRMANATVWAVANLAIFFVTGGTGNIAIVLLAFSFDVFLEVARGIHELIPHVTLHHKISQELKKDSHTQAEILALKTMQKQLRKETAKTVLSILYKITMVSLILVGMTMLFFPPTSGVGGIFLATGITLAAGSICAGFTKRLVTAAYNICKPPVQKIFGWVKKKIFTNIPNPFKKNVSKTPDIRIPSPMTYENLIPALSTKDSFEVPVKRGEKTPPIDIPHKSSKNTSKISPCSFMHTGAHHFLNCRGKPSSSHVPTISPKIASGST